MLTAHRPSFPTCLFHPRRVHLLCHLDSPSAASLPYLGLQEQTGPEVSRLYGSYRVPSKSSLLPLCTLSPGGVAHRPTSLTQSSTAWSQQPTGNTDTGFPKSVQQSQDDLTVLISEQGSMHRLTQLFLKQTRILPLESNTGFLFRKCAPGLPRTDTNSQFWTGCTWFPQDKHKLFGLQR
jgi:hypothetical protein